MTLSNLLVCNNSCEDRVGVAFRQFNLEEYLKQKRREGQKNERKLIREVINKVDVVCATCDASGAAVFRKFKFAHVLIDEATQAIGSINLVCTNSPLKEPSTLIPLVHGAKQIVLVGDHKVSVVS